MRLIRLLVYMSDHIAKRVEKMKWSSDIREGLMTKIEISPPKLPYRLSHQGRIQGGGGGGLWGLKTPPWHQVMNN